MKLKGRQKILTQFKNEDITNVSNLILAINNALQTHIINSAEIKYLIDYHNGIQPVLEKENATRPEINNIVVCNYAQMITRTIVNYFIGTPIQFTQSGYGNEKDFDKVRNEVEKLNQLLEYEDSAFVDMEVAKHQSICGTAYRIITTNNEDDDRNSPIEDRILDPQTTFVVYENNISSKPLFGVTYIPILSEQDGNSETNVLYQVFTSFGMYSFVGSKTGIDVTTGISNYEFTPYDVGGVPLIEYPNNNDRIGDWELVLTLMDSICNMYSNRVDDIQQIVQSLLVFVNVEMDEKRFDELRKNGVLSFINRSESKSEVFPISNVLNQSTASETTKELQDLLFSLVGIPSRDNRATGGGDTGTAVELRDGWADLENVVRGKEVNFKKCEKQRLKIITTILNKKLNFSLDVKDIVIKFTRNKNNNLLVKTQSLMNLLNSKVIAPADCIQLADLVTDVEDYSARGEQFWKDEFANRIGTEDNVESEENKVFSRDVTNNNVDRDNSNVV